MDDNELAEFMHGQHEQRKVSDKEAFEWGKKFEAMARFEPSQSAPASIPQGDFWGSYFSHGLHVEEAAKSAPFGIETLPPDTAPPYSKIAGQVIAMLRQRTMKGYAEYGTTLDGNEATIDARLQHWQEEALDSAQYIQWLRNGLRQKGVTQT
jgi:hypothetical protein